ncbi:carbonic anhydrase [Oscillatoria sp. FACHB-1406]|uniref:carbonic anhydrase n=1 Tax=Oscillatoria sp. FACHB-1406 TaxID=2692846 RepID=UPI0016853230|nr:carbonic anhydrase [Oscillatoria sp. FACHB-1406]MBD2578003.1 carbonic anhydrase [Oscillatoria sp. FACHB-1406]
MKNIISNRVSRRNILKVGAGFLGTSSLAAAIGINLKPQPAAAQNKPLLLAKTDITPDQALQELMDGNRRFVENQRRNPNQTPARITEVAMSQSPFAAILGCADSRFPSEMVFDQGIGDLFVCRVAGNLATDEEIGSLEFGTQVLGAKVIMVVGHKRCGAVKAAIEGGRYPGRISTLTDSIQLAVERSMRMEGGDDKLEKAAKANVVYQVEKLLKSPIIGELVDSGQLKIVGGYYDLDSGEVSLVS